MSDPDEVVIVRDLCADLLGRGWSVVDVKALLLRQVVLVAEDFASPGFQVGVYLHLLQENKRKIQGMRGWRRVQPEGVAVGLTPSALCAEIRGPLDANRQRHGCEIAWDLLSEAVPKALARIQLTEPGLIREARGYFWAPQAWADLYPVLPLPKARRGERPAPVLPF